jgi:DNA repair protein RecN (Recombination protein N)
MLDALRISGLGVIEHAELPLGAGLTVLTGETGAGKTMVLTALGLLMGGRADPSAVRSGSTRAEVEGVVRLLPQSPARRRAEEAGAVVEDDSVIVVRIVSAEGRSRAVLGGRSVPVAVLADLAEDLVAVHGQSAQVALLRPDRQRDLLDAYGAPATTRARAEVAHLYRCRADARRELAQVQASQAERASEIEMLREGVTVIEAVAPERGEQQRLEHDEARLAHAERLKQAAGRAAALVAGDELQVDSTDVLGLLAAARRLLDGVREIDETLGASSDRLAEASYLLVDVAADLSGYVHDLEVDPAALAAVSERRARLASLQRRFGLDVDDVLTWAEQARARLLELQSDEQQVPALEAQVTRWDTELGAAAARLSQARRSAAEHLGVAVTAELTALAMPQATLHVEVRQREDPQGVPAGGRRVACSAHGADSVELLLAPHPGASARPLDRGASGGELSRTMLALEVVLAAADPVPTLVFDEVDAGVGGRAAVDVGRRLARLARHAQVLVVTHLPQVAAFADHHYVVAKDTSGEVTASGVRLVTGSDRTHELARMMAGLDASSVALQHAQELLVTAEEER